MSLEVNHLDGFGGEPYSPEPFSASYLGGSTSSSYSVDFGDAHADRYAIICISYSSSAPSAVTVGGVSASRVVQHTGSFTNSEIWVAAIPTGAGSKTVSISGGVSRLNSGAWRAVGGSWAGTPTDTATGNGASITVNSGGQAFWAMYSTGGSGSNSPSGTASPTQRYLGGVSGDTAALGDASGTGTISHSAGGSKTQAIMAAA